METRFWKNADMGCCVVRGLYAVFWTCLIIGFGISDMRAQPGIVKSDPALALKVEFSRSLPPGLSKGIRLKRWRGRRKLVVLRTMVRLAKRAPGLVARATQYRRVRFYYLAGRYRATARASVTGNSIEFTDAFFKKGPKGRLAVLAHEISHLADSGYRISGSAGFTEIISPHIALARKALKRAKLTWYEAVSRGRHRQARKAGLPGAYGAYNQEEALAEGLGRYIAGWYKPSTKLKDFFEDLIQSKPLTSDPALVAWHRVQALLAAGARGLALDAALAEALGHNSKFTAAHLVRLKLHALQGGVDDFTRMVDVSLATAHAPFLKSSVHETAALAFLIRGRAVLALDHIRHAIAHVPGAAPLYLLRARILLALKKPKAALNDYRAARRLGRFHFTRQDRKLRRKARGLLRRQRLARRK